MNNEKQIKCQTLNLVGQEIEISCGNSDIAIRNDGTDTIYVSGDPGISKGGNGVVPIPAGGSVVVSTYKGKLYFTGTGSALVMATDSSANPFKTSAQSSGSGADEVARAAINTHSGNAQIHVSSEEKNKLGGIADGATKTLYSQILVDGIKLGELTVNDGQSYGVFCPAKLPADGGNADTLAGKHEYDFFNNISSIVTPESSGKPRLIDYIGSLGLTTFSFYTSGFSDLPSIDWGYNVTVNKTGGAFYAIAYKALSDKEIYVRSGHSYDEWNGNWSRINDGGNAASVGAYTEEKIAALEARIAALE